MKKYWILILLLFAAISCEKDVSKEVKDTEEKPSDIADEKLSLSGTITNSNLVDMGASAFKIQLIKGAINLTSFDDSYTYPNAQVFVTEKNKNNFEFSNLQEGEYTLVATKRGYKTSGEPVEVKKNMPNVTSIKMEKGGSSGFTGKIQILSEDGKDLSEIKINRNNTISIFFYLYNGKGTNESYSISYRHYEGYLGKSFIIDSKVEQLYSEWIKEIKPRSETLKPNEIQLVEVVIDPVVYLLKEHSKCDIEINRELKIELSY
jgi:hypothetical protein